MSRLTLDASARGAGARILIEAQPANAGVTITIDAVGGTMFRPLWKLLELSGRYVLYGFAEVGTARGISYLRAGRGLLSMGLLHPSSLVTANRTMAGFNLSVVPDQVPLLRGSAARLIELWRAGAIRPVLGERFPFHQLPDAHRLLASRRSTGRVVVTVQGSP